MVLFSWCDQKVPPGRPRLETRDSNRNYDGYLLGKTMTSSKTKAELRLLVQIMEVQAFELACKRYYKPFTGNNHMAAS